MRVLFVSPSIPSPLHRVRSLHLLKVLSARHDVLLVTLAPAHDPVHATEHLSFLARPPRVVRLLFSSSLRSCLSATVRRRPLEVAYCASDAMRAAVQEALAEFQPDLLYVKRLRAAQFVPIPPPCPTILDATDAMAASYRRAAPFSPPHLRPVFRYEAWAYARAESAAAAVFRHWVVSSPADASHLRQVLPPTVALHVIPNVVDTDAFAPHLGAEEPTHLLFSGLMDKVVNVSAATFFAREILPKIRARIPGVTFTIAGPRPTPFVRRLARSVGVSVAGYVPDLRREIARAAVVVVPVRSGTGTRNKILQAWAMGKAVVSTPEGAEGLAARHGENLLLADSAERFAAATVLLLKDADLRARLGKTGREDTERCYSLSALASLLEPVLAAIQKDRAMIGAYGRQATDSERKNRGR